MQKMQFEAKVGDNELIIKGCKQRSGEYELAWSPFLKAGTRLFYFF